MLKKTIVVLHLVRSQTSTGLWMGIHGWFLLNTNLVSTLVPKFLILRPGTYLKRNSVLQRECYALFVFFCIFTYLLEHTRACITNETSSITTVVMKSPTATVTKLTEEKTMKSLTSVHNLRKCKGSFQKCERVNPISVTEVIDKQ